MKFDFWWVFIIYRFLSYFFQGDFDWIDRIENDDKKVVNGMRFN